MRLSDVYDIPEEVARGVHSQAFEKFLWNWFGDTYAITHGELDLRFLEDLTPDEVELAQELVRRNLKLKYTHIIQGASLLQDISSVATLRTMLQKEPDEDRRLTIAGALWQLNRDPVFVEYLNHAKLSHCSLLDGAHLLKVLWLDDERAINILIDLLDCKERFVQYQTLSLLNSLEFDRAMNCVAREMPRQPDQYRKRRHDPAFREMMTAAVNKWNTETQNGRLHRGW